jgi:O-acetyl-ADP-ribose deacetylase (regulator of RNase III)
MIKYVEGDATEIPEVKTLLVHCVNDVGGWGAGFVLALSKKFPKLETAYRLWASGKDHKEISDETGLLTYSTGPLYLGEVQFVKVDDNLVVANLCGQKNTRYVEELPPVRYGSLHEGLIHCRRIMKKSNITRISMPRICSGLAGGNWNKVEGIIKEVFTKDPLPKWDITVYDLPKNPEI